MSMITVFRRHTRERNQGCRFPLYLYWRLYCHFYAHHELKIKNTLSSGGCNTGFRATSGGSANYSPCQERFR